MTIRPATPSDAQAVADVYNHYILRTVVTFEEHPVTAEEMRGRIKDVQTASYPWLVAEEAGAILGYAYAMQWKARSAYRYAAESTIYLAEGAVGRGLGTELYRALFAELRKKGLHVVLGGITIPNEPSVKLHEKFGFEKVAHFKEVGFKLGRWLDVGYWQVSL